jgi:hypothetical protein
MIVTREHVEAYIMNAWARMIEVTDSPTFRICHCTSKASGSKGGTCRAEPRLRHPESLGDLLGAVAVGAPIIDHANDAIFYAWVDGDPSRNRWFLPVDGSQKSESVEEVISAQRVVMATRYARFNETVIPRSINARRIPEVQELQADHTSAWEDFRILADYQPVNDITPEELAEVTRRIKGE